MAATIMVQQNDANNDPIEGENGPVFLTDIDAVTQIIYTTLRLLQGEWWEDLTIGFPLFQSFLRKSASANSQAGMLLILQQTILGVPYVQQILSSSLTSNMLNRGAVFTASVSTAFGTVPITFAPGSSATVTN